MLRHPLARKVFGGLIVLVLLILPLTTVHPGPGRRAVVPARAPMVALHPGEHRKVPKQVYPVPRAVKKGLPSGARWAGPARRPGMPGDELHLLARLIHAEAGGEAIRGQVAVGAVILNRIKSGRFPQTIKGNVFKNGEFESVSNGYIWSNPTASSYKAARLAVQGWDPTHGALYFYNPAKTTSAWIWSRPVMMKIGRHFFAA